jgi:hypothetical protein
VWFDGIFGGRTEWVVDVGNLWVDFCVVTEWFIVWICKFRVYVNRN